MKRVSAVLYTACRDTSLPVAGALSGGVGLRF